MDQLKTMKEQLMAQVQGQMGNLANVDTKELGEAIDMIKDLAEAIYYCTITEAMKEEPEEEKKYRQGRMYYTETPYIRDYPMYYSERPYGREYPAMYYSESSPRSGNTSYPTMAPGNQNQQSLSKRGEKDWREGKSPETRRYYMENKAIHKDKETQMKDLENYMKDLSSDITEMITGATPEEKQMLKTKMTTLINMI